MFSPFSFVSFSKVARTFINVKRKHLLLYSLGELSLKSIMGTTRANCIFCQICDGKDQDKVIYNDDECCVFPDIKPAAKHHYLVVTREHIPNAKDLTVDQKPIVEKLVEIGKRVLQDQGGDLSDVRFGFHWPPFTSISHLHLHVISPTKDLGFISRLIFKPDSWWFYTPEAVLARL